MKRAILTVGLGFGDEGKGATVDYLARRHDADLIVRYCGGSQAGHNVELPDGRRHTFSQFGAGTLAEQLPRTYLGSNMVVDPVALLREAGHLIELGVPDPCSLLTIHPDCLLTAYWHRATNQLRELARGGARHGSCGQGIGEARHYWLRNGSDAIVAADLLDERVLRQKLELLRQRTLLELQPLLERSDFEERSAFDLWNWNAEVEARRLREPVKQGITLSARMPESRMAIFEGAQGVLLDEYRGFHPHTTWSTVTAYHAWEMVEDAEEVCLLGITRAYATRHGEGPFPTYSESLTARLLDPGNTPNHWQGSLRCGWLDLPLLRYAARVAGPLDGMVVNHLDQVGEGTFEVCEEYENGELVPATVPNLAWQSQLTHQVKGARPLLYPATAEEILSQVNELAPVVVMGRGPTHLDRQARELRFCRRLGR